MPQAQEADDDHHHPVSAACVIFQLLYVLVTKGGMHVIVLSYTDQYCVALCYAEVRMSECSVRGPWLWP